MIFLSFSSFSQSAIEFHYSEVYIGRNIDLSWKKTVANFSVSAGLTYHINRIDKIPTGTLIKKSAIAKNFKERFGVQVGFDYSVFTNSHLALGVFYNNQTSFISQLITMYSPYATLVATPQSEFDFLYVKSESSFGPVLTVDNVIGLALKNKLIDNFYLTSKAGLGFLLWRNTDDSLLLIGGKKHNQSYNFTSFFSVGLGYTFKRD